MMSSTGGAGGRSSHEIRREIEERFGFFPPFFEPALGSSEELENLWQQTLAAYINNPLPDLFKERLFAYLSRFCSVPYCIVCHSCALQPLGMQAGEVLQLLEATPPANEEAIAEFLRLVSTEQGPLAAWPEKGSALDEALLQCSILVFLRPAQTAACTREIRRLLGEALYAHWSAFLAYVKSCHFWVGTHPELSYEADQRAIEHLQPLLEAEPALKEFFGNYQEKLREGRKRHEVQLKHALAQEQELKARILESRRVLASILEHTPMLVAYLDPQFNFIWVNRAYAAADEREPAFFPGRNHFDLYPSAENEAIFRQVVASGTTHFSYARAFEYAEHPERGTSYWDWSLIPVRDEQDTVIGVVLTLANVTPRIRAETEARVSRQEMERFFNLVPDLACIASTDGYFRRLNPAWQKTLGFTSEELLSRPFTEFIHPDDVAPTMAEVARQLANQSTANFINRYRCRDGTYRWLEWVATPAQGDLLYAAARDITERRQAEEALHLSRERYRQLAEAAHDMIFVLDREMRVEYSNQYAAERVGRTPEEITGIAFTELFPSTVHERQIANVQRVFATGNPLYVEAPIDMNRETIWLGTWLVPLKGANNTVHSVMGISRDITARRRIEEKLRLIADAGAIAPGEAFFRNLVRFAAEVCGVKVAFVAELLRQERLSAQSLAFRVAGEFVDNMRWELAETPCARVPEGRPIFYPDRLQDRFPGDKPLAELGVESYFCIPLVDSHGNVLGHMGIMDDKPMPGQEEIDSLLRIFAVRAGGELERKRHAETLRQRLVEIERMNRLMVGRELEMVRLKDEVNMLLERLGQPKRYRAPDDIDRSDRGNRKT